MLQGIQLTLNLYPGFFDAPLQTLVLSFPILIFVVAIAAAFLHVVVSTI